VFSKVSYVALALLTAAVLASVAAGASKPAAEPNDALTAARFSLTIDGVEIAAFSELAGITSEVEAPAAESTLKKLPGKRTPPTVTLKRGMTKNVELWAWHEAVLAGGPAAAKDATLVMYDTNGKPVARYHLEHAWPSKLEIGALKAGAGEVLYETVTITAENIQRLAA
jgi:phage tail-like protein